MTHGLIYICPECRKVTLFKAHEDGTFIMNKLMCADDGYEMRLFKLDDLFVDQMLKGVSPNAS